MAEEEAGRGGGGPRAAAGWTEDEEAGRGGGGPRAAGAGHRGPGTGGPALGGRSKLAGRTLIGEALLSFVREAEACRVRSGIGTLFVSGDQFGRTLVVSVGLDARFGSG